MCRPNPPNGTLMLKFHIFAKWRPFIFTKIFLKSYSDHENSNIHLHFKFHENLSSGSGDRGHTTEFFFVCLC